MAARDFALGHSMATIRLDSAEIQDGGLPPVCMVCGERAVQTKRQMFIWVPFWALFFGFLGYWWLWKIRVWAPLCHKHRYHWTWRWASILAGLVLVAAVGGIGSAILDIKLGSVQAKPYMDGLIYGCLAAAGLLFILFWIFRKTGIHPVHIDYDGITLKGVAEGFVRAVDRQRASESVPRVAPVRPAVAEALPVDAEAAVADALPVAEAVPAMQRPQRKPSSARPASRAWLWALLLGLLTLTCCGGGGGLLYWFLAVRGDPVVLSRAQFRGELGFLKYVEVQYRLRKPDYSEGVRYIWIIRAGDKTVLERVFQPKDLSSSGTLQGQISTVRGAPGADKYETWVEIEKPKPDGAGKERARVSNTLSFH
jgi:hypothetical protein